MSGRIRPSARKKTLNNVMRSNLSITDKGCIEEVFEKFEQLKADKEALIVGQETLQRALTEKNTEIAAYKKDVKELSSMVVKMIEQRDRASGEIVKDFAKYLIDKSENGVVSVMDIPDYVKEWSGNNAENI